MTGTAKKHLTKAKEYVAKGEEFYRLAGAEIVAAMEADPSLTQEQVGKWFGRKQPWVSKIISAYSRGNTAEPFADEENPGKRRSEAEATKKLLADPETVKEVVASLKPEQRDVLAKVVRDAELEEQWKQPTTKERQLARPASAMATSSAPVPVPGNAERDIYLACSTTRRLSNVKLEQLNDAELEQAERDLVEAAAVLQATLEAVRQERKERSQSTVIQLKHRAAGRSS